MRSLGPALLVVLAPACALLPRAVRTPPREFDATRDEVRSSVTREEDPYRKRTLFSAMSVGVGDGASARMVRTLSDNASEQISLHVNWSGERWKFLQSAYDIEGRALELRVESRNVSAGAGAEEVVTIRVSRSLLEEPRLGPLKLRLFGEQGNLDLEVPQTYIEGFLDALRTFDAAGS